MLVVIAVITVLASLMLPGLDGSRRRATRTVCVNNLKQMGGALGLYAGDNHGRLPFANWDGGVFGCPRGWLYYTTNNGNGSGIPDPGPGGNYEKVQNLAYQTGLWFDYTPNPRSYLCPTDTKSKTYAVPASRGGRNNRMSSYVMNGSACGFHSPAMNERIRTRISDVWSPQCYLMWEPDENVNGPGDPGAFEFNDGANRPDRSEGISTLHSTKDAYALTVSGGVSFITFAQWRAECDGIGTPGPGGKNLAWWNPASDDGH